MSKEQTPMNSERIKEIQSKTAFPDSISVQQALLKVWNECEQYHIQNTKAKVLEALEREVTIAYNAGKEYEAYKRMDLDPYTFGSEYYETEVKPKYKQINK